MKTILERPRRKLIAGQRSLIDPDEPPVTYCQVCGRRLKTPQSIEKRMGPTCLRKSNEHDCRVEAKPSLQFTPSDTPGAKRELCRANTLESLNETIRRRKE